MDPCIHEATDLGSWASLVRMMEVARGGLNEIISEESLGGLLGNLSEPTVIIFGHPVASWKRSVATSLIHTIYEPTIDTQNTMVFEEASKTSSLPEVSSQTKEKTVEVFDDQKHGVRVPQSPIKSHGLLLPVSLGYNVNDVIGKNCRILQGKNTDQKTVEFIRAALKRGEGCQVMILNYRKNGVPFWNRLSIQPLLDKHGRIRKFVGIQIERSLPVSRFAPVMPWKVGIKKEGPRLLTVASESAVKESGELQILEEKKSKPKISLHDVSFVAETNLPTIKGKYRVRAYKDNKTRQEIMCIIWGKIEASSGLHVRAHDQCFTSEVLGSLKCDCKQQLDFAMEHIKKTSGMVIYLPQEGRGMGLAHKIKAYAVQEHGYDT
eukprot:1248783-Amorphochlora_amoeboformis.AAC.1